MDATVRHLSQPLFLHINWELFPTYMLNCEQTLNEMVHEFDLKCEEYYYSFDLGEDLIKILMDS